MCICIYISLTEMGIPARNAYFGEGQGPIHWSRVHCDCSDVSLKECDLDEEVTEGVACQQNGDVGVICKGMYKTE